MISEARKRADKRRREREPYRKLFDHIRQSCRLKRPRFSKRMLALLGYDYEAFRCHMISKMRGRMTWALFISGKVQIGHIIPLATFNRSDPNDIKRAWALDNIEPTWPTTNKRKLRADRALIAHVQAQRGYRFAGRKGWLPISEQTRNRNDA